MKAPDKPIKSAFKPIRPTKPVTIAPPLISNVTSKRVNLESTQGNAPSAEPRTSVPVNFHLELTRRDDRDNFGWCYFRTGEGIRSVVAVLNASTWLVEKALLKADHRLIAFLAATLLVERLRRTGNGTPVREVFDWFQQELVPEAVSPENAWLSMRLVTKNWFTTAISDLPIYGLTPVIDFRYLITTLQIPLSAAVTSQPWRPFLNKKLPPRS